MTFCLGDSRAALDYDYRDKWTETVAGQARQGTAWTAVVSVTDVTVKVTS